MGDTRTRTRDTSDIRRNATSATHYPDAAARRMARTAKKARYRALRDGVIAVGVPVTNEIIGLLIDANYLDIATSEDPGAIAQAIEEMLVDASKHR